MTEQLPIAAPRAGSVLHDDLQTTVLQVIRPTDLLSLSFWLTNLAVQAGQLVRVDPNAPATIVVVLPPQHLAEAILGSPSPSDVAVPAAPSVLAGGSQLAFAVPDGVTALPLNLATLLGWAALTPVPAAAPAGRPVAPTGTDSILELPYRMLLAVDDAQWVHTVDAVVDPSTGAAELWRTRADQPALHVTWSQDMEGGPFKPPPGAPPVSGGAYYRWMRPAVVMPPSWPTVAGPLSAGDRVSITSAAPALDVDSLTLSALGASTSLCLAASLPGPSDGTPSGDVVTDWQHILSLGRDSYVKVASRGRLAPFGHPVTIVAVTERLPTTATFEGATAAIEGLQQSYRLIVNQPLVDYTDAETATAMATHGIARALPFTQVHLPDQAMVVLEQTSSGVVQSLAGVPVQFRVVAQDLSGAAIELSLPMVYVQDGDKTSIEDLYPPSPGSAAAAAAVAAGQQVAFVAPSGAAGSPDAALNSVLPVDSMTFTVSSVMGSPHPFLPSLDTAMVQVPAVSALAAGALSGPLPIVYDPTYLANGIDADLNPGGLFAAVKAPPALSMAASAAGGLIAPQFNVEGLATNLGPVADVQGLLGGGFDPTKLLSRATFLGGIKLSDLVATITNAAFDATKLPSFVHRQLPPGGVPTSVETTFSWTPALKPAVTPSADDAGLRPFDDDPVLSIDTSQSTLALTATVTAALDGSAPTYVVDGDLKTITFTFLDAITLTVGELRFHVESGQKLALHTGQMVVGFINDLSFVNALAHALPPDGLGDGVHIDVDSQGITAGYGITLPAIGVGYLSIENVAFSAALALPFDGPLGLKLGFSSREHPFLVSVSFIAGGGYFLLDVDSHGVNAIEGALELGADLSLDFVIVDAEVHALAGFYFGMDKEGGSFGGFLRVGGSVDLLGLISVSIELYLGLDYSENHSQITGSASLTLSVHLMFVTKSVTLRMQKSFDVPSLLGPGPALDTGGPATFRELIAPEVWTTYVAAFA